MVQNLIHNQIRKTTETTKWINVLTKYVKRHVNSEAWMHFTSIIPSGKGKDQHQDEKLLLMKYQIKNKIQYCNINDKMK